MLFDVTRTLAADHHIVLRLDPVEKDFGVSDLLSRGTTALAASKGRDLDQLETRS